MTDANKCKLNGPFRQEEIDKYLRRMRLEIYGYLLE